MTTKIYGSGDDIIGVEGDVDGETWCDFTEDREHGVLLVCSDGTLLEVGRGKSSLGVWVIRLVEKGELFDKIERYSCENLDTCGDVAMFRNGLKWVYAASSGWELVK